MTPAYANQVPVGATFETPEGFRYRVRGRTGSGVLVVPVATAAVRRFKTAEGTEISFTASHEPIVISDMTEVERILDGM